VGVVFLLQVGLDLNVPTLFLAECVLMYMPEKECDGLLSYFSQTFTNSHFISYDVVSVISCSYKLKLVFYSAATLTV